jgi:peptidoglycan/xylan/chitin deacetylase (PgdA/CDA1 family)
MRPSTSVTPIAAALARSALVLPALAVAGSPVHAGPLQVVIAEVISVSAFLLTERVGGGRSLALLGATMGAVSAWLLSQATAPAAVYVVAPSLGAGLGLVSRSKDNLSRPALLLTLAAGGVLVGLRVGAGRDAAMAAGAGLSAIGAGACLLRQPPPPAFRLPLAALFGAGGLVLVVTVAYFGATSPRVTWFGALTYRGPGAGNMVAITFDDGPNDPYTLKIRDILDAHGVKATFFTVGKALDARPDISKALADDGHLLGNHAYKHDAVSWLDPGYPELAKTEAAFKRDLDLCPAFFRPPHGTHTPFMSHIASDHDMRLVTWDVSAADWATQDGELVARRVLDRVKPGSIILLHDGVDGDLTSDRSVMLTALPIILDGLRERGLEPVRLDVLLGGPGYLDRC